MAYYPLPKIDDLSMVKGAWFSVIDMTHAYMQLEVDSATAEILTWNTHFGLYRVNMLVYGIVSAGAIFQSAVERIPQGLPGLFIYQDDVLIAADDKQACEDRTHQVLERLNSYNVQCRIDKCRLNCETATAPFTSHGASRYLQDENLGSWVRLVAYVGPRHRGRRSQMRAMSDQPPSAESCTVTPLAVVYQTVAAILYGLC